MNYPPIVQTLAATMADRIPLGDGTVKQVGKTHVAYKKMISINVTLRPIFQTREARLAFMSNLLGRWIGSLYHMKVGEVYAIYQMIYPEGYKFGQDPHFMNYVETEGEVFNGEYARPV